MERILNAILGSSVPVITYVTPQGAQAGSAATFITLAGDVAAMAPTNIGAASVVGSGGEDLPDTLADKVNNTRARIRSLAERHGRNAEWADSRSRLPALRGRCRGHGAAGGRPPGGRRGRPVRAIDAGARADGRAFDSTASRCRSSPSWRSRRGHEHRAAFLHLLSDPNVAFILFTIGFYGILSELCHPNFFSGPVGAIAIVAGLHRLQQPAAQRRRAAADPAGHRPVCAGADVTSLGLLTVGGVAASCWAPSRCGPASTRRSTIRVSISPWLLAVVIGCRWPTFGPRAGLLRCAAMRRRRPAVGGAGWRRRRRRRSSPRRGSPMLAARLVGAQPRAEIRAGSPVNVVGVEGLELIVEPATAGDGRSNGGMADATWKDLAGPIAIAIARRRSALWSILQHRPHRARVRAPGRLLLRPAAGITRTRNRAPHSLRPAGGEGRPP